MAGSVNRVSDLASTGIKQRQAKKLTCLFESLKIYYCQYDITFIPDHDESRYSVYVAKHIVMQVDTEPS